MTAAATLGPAGLTGSKGLLAYLRAGPPPSEGSVTFDPHDHFDLARVRRLDRGARLLTLSMQVAMREARLGGGPAVGAIAGSAYGTVDASAEFVRRIYSKGAKLASPLVFPNLVPSSLVGHAAIYPGPARSCVFGRRARAFGRSGIFGRLRARRSGRSFGHVGGLGGRAKRARRGGARAGVLRFEPLDGGSCRRVVCGHRRRRVSCARTRRAFARPGSLFSRGEGHLRCREPCTSARRRRFRDRAATRRRDPSGARSNFMEPRKVHRTRASNRQSRGARRMWPSRAARRWSLRVRPPR